MKNKVRMLKTDLGCDDGVVIPQTYREGEEYDIGDSLLSCFVDRGVVELVTSKEPKPEDREFKVTAPAETKPAAALKKKAK